MARPFRVALTGGIASGKSTVADLFSQLGVVVVDTDLLAREVVQPGTALNASIAAHFGREILGPDGNLDRRALRSRIFADPAERKWLESQLHPAIRQLTDERCAAAAGPYCLVAIPLLVETGGADRFDRVLVVDCEPEQQRSRLMARDGMTREQADNMLAAQASRQDRLAVADDVIRNDGHPRDLREPVAKLHQAYVAAAKAHAQTPADKA